MLVVAAPFTLEDYLTMPDDGRRYEIVDGQPIAMPAPTSPHQRAISRLLSRLAAACPPGYEVLPSPVDWVLWQAPRLQIRQPDLVIRPTSRGRRPASRRRHCWSSRCFLPSRSSGTY